MVFYRKYRPQNFEELVGQDHVKKTLLAAFANGKLGHAYLFCGPRGSGKTSAARILAKIVNCESKDAEVPCNKCMACVSITDGSNMDLIEIDAASNRGIDDIRDLREKIKLAPSSLKKKVYIIDEVHMLTTEAFNALLKTLEEPPEHVLFILATTEVHKLPQTILSRVQRFDFKLATGDEIKLALKNITEKEEIKISDEVLSLVAEVSEGSFRDAVKNLDQLAGSSDDVTLELAQSILKANDFSEIMGLLESVVAQDSKKALKQVSDINEKGANVKEFINSILKSLRQLMLIQNGAGEGIKIEVGSAKWEVLEALSKKIPSERLIGYIENFQKSLEQLKYTTIASLPLEVAVIKSSGLRVEVSESRRDEVVVVARADVKSANSDAKEPSVSPTLRTSDPIPNISDLPPSNDVIIITDKWTYILETIRPYNYSLEALLKQTKVVNCDHETVILEVPYSFHQRILEAPKSRTLLESVLADVLGKSVRVTTVLGKREISASELANVEVAQDDEIVRLASEIFNS